LGVLGFGVMGGEVVRFTELGWLKCRSTTNKAAAYFISFFEVRYVDTWKNGWHKKETCSIQNESSITLAG
jgi:hypothetical protein